MHTYCIEEHKAPNKKFGLYLGLSLLLLLIGIIIVSVAHVYLLSDSNSLLITDVFGITMIVLGSFLSFFSILEKNERVKFNGEDIVYEMLFHKKIATADRHYVTFVEKTNNKDMAYLNLLVYRKGELEKDQEPYFVYSFVIPQNDINNIKPILLKWVPLLLESNFEIHMTKRVAEVADQMGVPMEDISIYSSEPVKKDTK